jgi:hypothetical protein
MNNGIRYGEGMQIANLFVGEITANDKSKFVHVGNAHHVTFLLGFGTVDTATTITVRESSAASTVSAEAIPFYYRLSGASSADNTDTWGAITSADSAGVALTATTDTGKFLLIDIDPDDLSDGDKYLQVVTAATNYSTAGAFLVAAFLEPRYPQNVHMSDT